MKKSKTNLPEERHIIETQKKQKEVKNEAENQRSELIIIINQKQYSIDVKKSTRIRDIIERERKGI
jgi:hypothetical protein